MARLLSLEGGRDEVEESCTKEGLGVGGVVVGVWEVSGRRVGDQVRPGVEEEGDLVGEATGVEILGTVVNGWISERDARRCQLGKDAKAKGEEDVSMLVHWKLTIETPASSNPLPSLLVAHFQIRCTSPNSPA